MYDERLHDTAMTSPDLVDRLAAHKTLGVAPREELTWLAAHGVLRHLEAGDILTSKGQTVEGLFVVLEGRIAIFVNRAGGLHKTLEWRSGDVTGMLPYSRLTTPPGDTIAQEPTEIFSVSRDALHDMIHECQGITSILVHTMLDRARAFNASDLHDEKMVSLGKLSAGLAHELNNPASAIERSAAHLEDRLNDSEEATRVIGAARLSDAQLAAVDAFRHVCLEPVRGVRSPIEHAEREEAIADWLAAHGVDTAAAEPLAETAVTIEALEEIGRAVSGSCLQARRALDLRRMFGPPARVRDPGCGDAHLRIGRRHQGIHAHGPGQRCRAGRSHAGARQHGRGAEIKSAEQVGVTGRQRRSRTCRACADLPAN